MLIGACQQLLVNEATAPIDRHLSKIWFISISLLIISVPYYFTHGDDNSSYVSAIGKDDDKFGIMKIYPTANNGETWFFILTNPIDGQFDPNEANITKNTDGSGMFSQE